MSARFRSHSTLTIWHFPLEQKKKYTFFFSRTEMLIERSTKTKWFHHGRRTSIYTVRYFLLARSYVWRTQTTLMRQPLIRIQFSTIFYSVVRYFWGQFSAFIQFEVIFNVLKWFFCHFQMLSEYEFPFLRSRNNKIRYFLCSIFRVWNESVGASAWYWFSLPLPHIYSCIHGVGKF